MRRRRNNLKTHHDVKDWIENDIQNNDWCYIKKDKVYEVLNKKWYVNQTNWCKSDKREMNNCMGNSNNCLGYKMLCNSNWIKIAIQTVKSLRRNKHYYQPQEKYCDSNSFHIKGKIKTQMKVKFIRKRYEKNIITLH